MSGAVVAGDVRRDVRHLVRRLGGGAVANAAVQRKLERMPQTLRAVGANLRGRVRFQAARENVLQLARNREGKHARLAFAAAGCRGEGSPAAVPKFRSQVLGTCTAALDTRTRSQWVHNHCKDTAEHIPRMSCSHKVTCRLSLLSVRSSVGWLEWKDGDSFQVAVG